MENNLKKTIDMERFYKYCFIILACGSLIILALFYLNGNDLKNERIKNIELTEQIENLTKINNELKMKSDYYHGMINMSKVSLRLICESKNEVNKDDLREIYNYLQKNDLEDNK